MQRQDHPHRPATRQETGQTRCSFGTYTLQSPACYPSGNRSDALQLRHVHVAVDAVDAFSWALIEAVQRAGLDTAAGAVKARIIARRGNQTRNIAKVAAARKLLTLIYYGLRDGQIHALSAPAARTAPAA